MPLVPTMKITYLDGGDMAIINVEDFDPTKHVRWEEAEQGLPSAQEKMKPLSLSPPERLRGPAAEKTKPKDESTP